MSNMIDMHWSHGLAYAILMAMIHAHVTVLYAGLLGLLMSILSIRVPMRRGTLNVAFGDGGDQSLATRIRAFGNFSEYVPFVLLQMYLLEIQGTSVTWLHAMGIALVLARGLHAFIYVASNELTVPQKIGRGIAAMSTWMILTAAAGLLLYRALS